MVIRFASAWDWVLKELVTQNLLQVDSLERGVDQNRNFKFIKGPIFLNIILADEIKRLPLQKLSGAVGGIAGKRAVT